MPRKRRFAKRRPPIPDGLATISRLELARWRSRGPLLETDVDDGWANDAYVLWPDLNVWGLFYGRVRDELHAQRPARWAGSVVEALYGAWLTGADLDAVRGQIEDMQAATDPRLLLDGI